MNPIVEKFLRTAVSLLIAIIFVAALLVASAQQEAVSALRGKDVDLSYSVALRTVAESDKDRDKLSAQSNTKERLRRESRNLERQKSDREAELYAALQQLDFVAKRIVKSGRCEALGDAGSIPAVPDLSSVSQYLSLWRTVQACGQDGTIPANIDAQFKSLLSPASNPAMIQPAIARHDRDIKQITDDLKSNEEESEKLRTSIKNAELVRNLLQDVLLLKENVGLGILAWAPPPLMQIIVSLISGLFGALLITLILVVYPSNRLKLTKSDAFWSRILLGGLIALGVYVMIGGGVAMIGASQALTTSNANFLSFCAIGILAGMFSDRVAEFLSARSQIFLGSGSGGGQGSGQTLPPLQRPQQPVQPPPQQPANPPQQPPQPPPSSPAQDDDESET